MNLMLWSTPQPIVLLIKLNACKLGITVKRHQCELEFT